MSRATILRETIVAIAKTGIAGAESGLDLLRLGMTIKNHLIAIGITALINMLEIPRMRVRAMRLVQSEGGDMWAIDSRP